MPPERLLVNVSRMAPEGEAIAYAEGSPRVVFVPYGVPGDALEADVVSAKSSFARARIKRLVSSGPERVEPPCSVHFRAERPDAAACGGCDWQQLSYEAQLRHKRAIVIDCLSRIAKMKDVPVAETLPSPQPWGYRNKVQIPFGPPAPGEGRPRLGFYAPGSHRIVPFETCAVQPELSLRVARRVQELAGAYGWAAYEEDRGRGWLRHLFVRTNAVGRALAALVTSTPDFPKREEFVAALRAAFPEVAGIHHNVQPQKTSVILGPDWRCLWGAKSLEERLGRFTFLVSPGAFLQVNTPAAERLYDAALAALAHGGRSFDLALDLYCGVGTLSLWVSGAVPKVQGVEENRDAVRDAYKNAERNGVTNVRFSAGRAEAVLPRLAKDRLPASCAAIADPPRTGIAQPVLRFLTDKRIKRIVYVSCNPATFARDAGYLAHSGFKLVSVQPADLFPQTSHVELVGLLDRS